mgnify:CR=1 FL=1
MPATCKFFLSDHGLRQISRNLLFFMDAIFFLNNALLGVGLSMDAFSVSLANGLNEPYMGRGKRLAIAGTFAFFQALMPMLGWFLVHELVSAFSVLSKFVPYAALILLAFIGGKMIVEALKNKTLGDETEEKKVKKLSFGTLFLQGVATSIDALSVGFTIEKYDFVSALVASLVIATVTFAICISGVHIGKKFGMRFADKAQIAGGVILILIGIEIFIKGILGL